MMAERGANCVILKTMKVTDTGVDGATSAHDAKFKICKHKFSFVT